LICILERIGRVIRTVSIEKLGKNLKILKLNFLNMELTKNTWNKIYKEKGKICTKPQEDMPKIAKLFEQHKVKRILDLGCGTGRHLVFLAKKAFEVYGIDISEQAIKIAKKWLKEEGLKAKLRVGNIFKKLPYEDGFFDAIICVKTLNHGKIEWIRRCIREMNRVLKKESFVFVTVHKHQGVSKIPKGKRFGIKWIAPRTYIILGGPEKGVPHYRFNKKILISEFKKFFKVKDFWIDSENYYCLLAQK
jgi:ubiquinone/menaquinone biosynthesis C-methylase UbiE